jgi:hypothetical protein
MTAFEDSEEKNEKKIIPKLVSWNMTNTFKKIG